jgi:choline dehydrogenase-like flavoprotein
MALTYLPYAEGHGVRVFSRARADRVLWHGHRAVGVAGRGFQLEARRGVIVAASAIQTPLLLARSGVRSAHLGRHLQAHPGLEVAAVFDRPVRMWWGATQGYEIDQYRTSDRAKIETVALPPELHFAALAGVGRRWVAAMAESEHVAVWAVALRAFAQGRVSERFGATNIGFDLDARDMAYLNGAIRRTADLFFAAGARYVLPGIRGLPDRIGPNEVAVLDDAPRDPGAYTFILSHLFGTARMSVRAEDGVVGTDFAVHGRRGLTVVDSSVFPTNLGVNPQHTIMAIAMHAAERIAEEK